MKRIGLAVVLGVLTVGAVVFHAQTAAGIYTAGERCLRVLLPSLYGFSILAAYSVKIGLPGLLAKPLRFISGRYEARLVAVLLFSQVGGYPVGAQLLHTMREDGSITAAEESRLLCVCMGCGPGFLLGTVCGKQPVGVGLWLLLSVSLPNLLLAPLVLPRKAEMSHPPVRKAGVQFFTEAVESAAAAMLKITAMVTAFGAVLGILDGMGLPDVPVLRSLLEISCVTAFTAAGGSLPGAAALLAFGGVCVHLQAAAICEGNVRWLLFWAFRAAAAAMAYVFAAVGMQFLGAEQVFLPEIRPAVYGGSILPGLCLLLMSVMLCRKKSV